LGDENCNPKNDFGAATCVLATFSPHVSLAIYGHLQLIRCSGSFASDRILSTDERWSWMRSILTSKLM